MIIDSHVHLFPPEIVSNRDRFFAGEPEFKLLYESPQSKLVLAEDLLNSMAEEGVDRAVVFGFPWRDMGVARLCNDYILEKVRTYPDRLIGLACFGFDDPSEAAAEAERCLAAGLQGVGELAFYIEGFTQEVVNAFFPVIEVLRTAGRPLMLHTNEPVGHQYPGKCDVMLRNLDSFLRLYGDVPTIFAHWGGGFPFFHLLKREMDEVVANLYYDTAASPYLYKPMIYHAVGEMIGYDHILLGTDYPLLKPSRYFAEMEQAGISREQKALICGLNAARLFGITVDA
ncbi:MAG: amidohydrolase [Deltaproteobacteria bacterium]|nr:amidohydrolase [Candidatus Anaeroferrophillus wilburensis]MBN2888322.1 amidohydrolase [Deltaproteobacteria bacterium]